MSTFSHLFDLQEQICYVQCGYCSTILLVGVPCSSLTAVETVRCGHCTSLLSVNMMRASFLPLHLLGSFMNQSIESATEVYPDRQEEEVLTDNKVTETHIPSPPVVSFSSSDEKDDEENRVINKPPEKRQRAPSAYNLFIGQEIQRLKAINPTISHKQAFSMAAKNWAHFPLGQQKAEENQVEKDATLPLSLEEFPNTTHNESCGFP